MKVLMSSFLVNTMVFYRRDQAVFSSLLWYDTGGAQVTFIAEVLSVDVEMVNACWKIQEKTKGRSD